MFRWLHCCVLAGLILAAPAFADEGRIPIYERTTISVPGSYVVTRDIVIDADYAIRIDASPVQIDLNGFTLRSTDWGRMIILMI